MYKFKVGDKVRLTEKSLAANKSFSGERTIVKVNDGFLPDCPYYINSDAGTGIFSEDELILVPTFKFKVGDKVKIREDIAADFIGKIIRIDDNVDIPWPYVLMNKNGEEGNFLEEELTLDSTEEYTIDINEDEDDTNGIGEYITVGMDFSGMPEVYHYDSKTEQEMMDYINGPICEDDDVSDEMILYKKVRVLRRKEKIVWE